MPDSYPRNYHKLTYIENHLSTRFSALQIGLRPMAEREGFEPTRLGSEGVDLQNTYRCVKCGNTQIDSQSSDAHSPELSDIVKAWGNMTPEIQAILIALAAPYIS
tara:strand:- start:200 stop:514 length:315 start_codon:yes stop_codon:yes gene_type:complete